MDTLRGRMRRYLGSPEWIEAGAQVNLRPPSRAMFARSLESTRILYGEELGVK